LINSQIGIPAGIAQAFAALPTAQETLGHRDFAAQKNLLTYLAVLCDGPSMLSKELVAASTVPLVLSVLAQGESYGYALIQSVRDLSGGRITWTEGMLYPVLHWMADEGLVESEWKEAETGRRRKYYRICKEGRKALQAERQQWLTVHATLTKLWKTQPSLI
jgi:PadR family transcriptional regulator